MSAAKAIPGVAVRGVLRRQEPMSRHVTWRAGGPVACWFEPADVADLAAFLGAGGGREALLWVGNGSNLLVRDGGFDGIAIATARGLAGIERIGPRRLRVGAGTACARVARVAAGEGLSGSEFLIGIPGTMGGALAMNAGAFGGETWSLVCAVQTIDAAGRVHRRPPEAFEVGYRRVSGPSGEWFVAAELELQAASSPAEGERRLRALLAERARSQPVGVASCGSVFRNPPGAHAAALIERCGLKGLRLGGCRVSEKHANFIINDRGASATDIEALIEHVREVVARRTGVRLEPEVRIVGRPAEGGR